MDAPTPQRLTYTISESEIAIGLSRATLYRMMGRGELQTVKCGGRRLVPADELRRLSGAANARQTA